MTRARIVYPTETMEYRVREFGLLMHKFIQLMQSTSPPRFPGEGRDPLLPWAPAFAGVAGLV